MALSLSKGALEKQTRALEKQTRVLEKQGERLAVLEERAGAGEEASAGPERGVLPRDSIWSAVMAMSAVSAAAFIEAFLVIFFQRHNLTTSTSSLSDAADRLSDGVSLGIKNPVNDDAGVTGMI